MIGVSGSLEAILRVELFEPFDVGLNVTFIVKVLPGLIVLLPPPPAIKNMGESVPVISGLSTRSAFPLFLTLKLAVLLFRTFTVPKSLDMGFTEMSGTTLSMATVKESDHPDTTEVSWEHRALARTSNLADDVHMFD